MTDQNASPTLDGLFRRVLARQPDAIALIDPSDKARVTGTEPRTMTFDEANRAIEALTSHFHDANLPPNSVIAVQLPNTIEFVITLLAAHRAGLVVAMLPQLWRQADLTVAINRTGARAIVSCGRIDGISHADLVMNAAAEAFSIRHVCGFGPDLPEGMSSLDQVMSEPYYQAPSVVQDARRAAIVTFDVTAQGLRTVPRTHLNVISGGLTVLLEGAIPHSPTIISAIAPSSFAAVSSVLATWLLSGGTLALHHPFDPDTLAEQINNTASNILIAPATLVQRLADAGFLNDMPTIHHIVGLWRSPEQASASPRWIYQGIELTDVYLFGEAGLYTARRGEDGLPKPIKPGQFYAPLSATNTSVAGEIIITPRGTLGLRGSMVPLAAYNVSLDVHRIAPEEALDHVDTGYAARFDKASGTIEITAPPHGVFSIGGYRFIAHELTNWAKRLGPSATLTAVPDSVSGHRLAGQTTNNARAREALAELGLNPLMVEAFRERAIAD